MDKESNMKKWIVKGYAVVAKEGFDSLKVETLSKLVGKNKSSFYHYFSDLDIFKTELLNYHVQKSVKIAEKALLCKSVMPDLISLLLKIKEDIFFNKQLRIKRNIKEYSECISKAHLPVERAFFMLGLKS